MWNKIGEEALFGAKVVGWTLVIGGAKWLGGKVYDYTKKTFFSEEEQTEAEAKKA